MKFIIFVLSLCIAHSIFAHEKEQPAITVNGSAFVSMAPDILTFSIYVEKKGANASELFKQVEKTTTEVVDTLKKNAVKEQDIQALAVSLFPWYERNGQAQQQKGFVFNRNIKVTIRDFQSYPIILDKLLTMGVSRVDSYQFAIEDPAGAYNLALDKAIQDARAKATLIAKSANIVLGEVIMLDELSSNRVQAQSQSRQLAMQDSSYLPGQNQVTASVSVSFAIEQINLSH